MSNNVMIAEENLRVFKEMLRSDLIREIPEILFQPGAEDKLRECITQVVAARYKRSLSGEWRKALVRSLMVDIDRTGRQGLMSFAEEDAADKFIRLFKEQIRPALVNGVPDNLLQAGCEEKLEKRIVEIVDARLVSDKIPIGRKLRIWLIESLLADIARAREQFGQH